MALSVLGALIFLILALLGQSPRLARRLGVDIYRLDLRVRALNGYALAGLLLALGFFLAGVPLGPVAVEPTAPAAVGEEGATDEVAALITASATITTTKTSGMAASDEPAGATATRPASGAFGGGPNSLSTPTAPASITETASLPSTTANEAASLTPPATATGTPTPVSTATATPTRTPTPTSTASRTPTPTSTPTQTPTPTLTPTPIVGTTEIIDSDGSDVWIQRSPGGQLLVFVSHGATVIIMPGHANYGGELWQEIMTVEGVRGWIEARFLASAS